MNDLEHSLYLESVFLVSSGERPAASATTPMVALYLRNTGENSIAVIDITARGSDSHVWYVALNAPEPEPMDPPLVFNANAASEVALDAAVIVPGSFSVLDTGAATAFETGANDTAIISAGGIVLPPQTSISVARVRAGAGAPKRGSTIAVTLKIKEVR